MSSRTYQHKLIYDDGFTETVSFPSILKCRSTYSSGDEIIKDNAKYYASSVECSNDLITACLNKIDDSVFAVD